MTTAMIQIVNSARSTLRTSRARGESRRETRSIERWRAWWVANAAPSIAIANVPARMI